MALALAFLVFGGILYGYVLATDRAQWSAYSLSAQSLALQGVKQARGARWDPRAWPIVDELGTTNFVHVEQLHLSASGEPIWATNYISVSTVSVAPPLRQLRADCVWMMPSRGKNIRGPFTNTVISLRSCDQ